MICERCGQRQANISFTQIINGNKSEAHLCNECASEIGEFGLGGGMEMPFQNFLSGLLNQTFWGEPSPPQEKTCPKCGLTYDGFRQTGRLGCAQCYDTFNEELAPLLRRIQGGIMHKGKSTRTDAKHAVTTADKVGRLQAELKKAIESENYERAAELRDAIQAMQKEAEG